MKVSIGMMTRINSDRERELQMKTIYGFSKLDYEIIIVDDSKGKYKEDFLNDIKDYKNIFLFNQRESGVGMAQREIFVNIQHLGNSDAIIYTEPDKYHLAKKENIDLITKDLEKVDYIGPTRSKTSWECLPKFQVMEEKAQNASLDILGNYMGYPSLDWTFGPFAVKKDCFHYFSQRYFKRPEMKVVSDWGHTFVGKINMMLDKKNMIPSEPLEEFYYDAEFKREDEDPVIIEYRIKQFNQIVPICFEFFFRNKDNLEKIKIN